MRYVAAFALIFVMNWVLHGIMEGYGGIAVTRLTANITATSTTLNVANTNGFLDSDYVIIGDEQIKYRGKTTTTFVVDTRGYNGTEAKAHAAMSNVDNTGGSMANSLLGFNPATTSGSLGSVNMMTSMGSFVIFTVPKLVTWNFAHFQVSPWLQYIRWIFMAVSAGFTFWLIMQYAGTFIGGALSFFRR